MTQGQLYRYLAGLWEKHGKKDKHGYVDLMTDDGFYLAARQILDDFGVDIAKAKTRH